MANLNPFTALAQEGEPAVNTGRAVAVAGAVLTFLVAFGVDLSEKQVIATMGLVLVVAPLVQGYLTRRKVTPADQVVAQEVAPGVVVAGPALENVPDGEPVEVFAEDDPFIDEL